MKIKSTLKTYSWVGPVLVGVFVGALNLAHYGITAGVEGVENRFGFFPGGSIVLFPAWIAGSNIPPHFQAIVIFGLGIVVGSFIYAVSIGELTWRRFRKSPLRRKVVWQSLIGGLLMGFGLMLSEGCSIRHFLSGASLLQFSSLVTLPGMILGIWLGVKILVKTL